jgi:hypothetical protein
VVVVEELVFDEKQVVVAILEHNKIIIRGSNPKQIHKQSNKILQLNKQTNKQTNKSRMNRNNQVFLLPVETVL